MSGSKFPEGGTSGPAMGPPQILECGGKGNSVSAHQGLEEGGRLVDYQGGQLCLWLGQTG